MKRNMMRFQKSGGGDYEPEMPANTPINPRDSARLQEDYLTNARQRAASSRRDYFDDDDEEGHSSTSHMPPLPESESRDNTEDDNGDADEIDPLDAFMQGIEQKVEEEKHTVGTTEQPEIVSGLDGDLEEYVPATVTRDDNDEVPDGDQYAYDSDGLVSGRVPPGKKEIQPLSPVDHSTIHYMPFRKEFYKEHDNIKALDEAEVARMRQSLELTVSGSNVPRPIRSFMEANFQSGLLREIAKIGFESPTPIQAQAIPVALSGRDVIGIAKTGSGKTFSFVWPAIIHAMDQPRMRVGDGPIVLILAPTRELVSQIYSEAKKFCKPFGLEIAAIFGGAGKWEMKKALKNGPHIVVATPGRIIDMIKGRATNLERCTMMVLDEADRMFDMGFEYQMRSVVNNVRPDRQTMLFSATFKRKVEALAREILNDPVRLMVGNLGQANEDVHQVVEVLRDDSAKWSWLTQRLDSLVVQGKLLIFVSSKQGSDQLAENLNKYTAHTCGTIHGDRDQSERTTTLRKFKTGEIPILVATDVAARGLDIKDIKNVVNFDVAKNIETHVHRIGRTGRMGADGVQPGTAYTLVTNTESVAAIDLVRNLRVSKQQVPTELERLAQSNPKYHAAMNPRREKQTQGLGFSGSTPTPMTSGQMAAGVAHGRSNIGKRGFDHVSGAEANQAPRKSRFGGRNPAASVPSPLPPAQRTTPALKGFVPASSSATSHLHSVTGEDTTAQQESSGTTERRRKSRWDS